YLDAVNSDLKYFSGDDYIKYSSGRLQPVLDTLRRIKDKGIWLEITTLIIFYCSLIYDKIQLRIGF
ncbi:unnamed protein product, partial [marine sediment metagenome]